jgi:hypothetical protein
MMKKLTSRKLVSMLVVALFMLSFAGIAVSSEESQETEVEKMTMTGMISDITETGQITILGESSNAVTLTAGPDASLHNFKVGDHVVVEYTNDMVIESISKMQEQTE